MTISLSALAFIGADIVLFIGVTLLCWFGGLFDVHLDRWAWPFLAINYTIFWLMPTVIAWAVWATWGPH